MCHQQQQQQSLLSSLLRVPVAVDICAQGIGKRKTYEGSWIQTLNKAGYSCAGIDNRGSGRSNGLFGYVNDHKDWVNDMVSSSHPSSPSSLTAAGAQERG